MDVFNHIHDLTPGVPGHSHDKVRAALLSSEERLLTLEKKFGRLALITHGLWELLKDRHGYTEDELRDWINLTDLKDGRLDGRVQTPFSAPRQCMKCNRVVSREFNRCMYCDEITQTGDAFDRVH